MPLVRGTTWRLNCRDCNREIALRAAINCLRDSVEAGKMPSGLPLEQDAREMHERAISHLEEMLRQALAGEADQ